MAISAFYLFIKSNSKTLFFSGFFIGVFWFYWIGISFEYYNLPYLKPIAIISIGFIYGAIFFLGSYLIEKLSKKSFHYALRALFLYTLSYIEPFGFNWFKPQLILVDSLLRYDQLSFFFILLIITSFIYFKKKKILLLLLLLLNFNYPKIISSKENIKFVTTYIDVREKWKVQNIRRYFDFAIKQVDLAIKNKKRLIIFPESFLPIFLNQTPLKEEFIKRSNKITIIIGSLYQKEDIRLNSAYIFKNGKYIVANKVVLVPFGEENPLPKFMGKIINKIFYDGAKDYIKAQSPTDIEILGKKFRVGICYEGTSDLFYKNSPPNIIIISNNGWFVPSIEPTLQKLLLIFYASTKNKIIYHIINGSKSYIIDGRK